MVFFGRSEKLGVGVRASDDAPKEPTGLLKRHSDGTMGGRGGYVAREWPEESKARPASGKGSRSIETLDGEKDWLTFQIDGAGTKRNPCQKAAGIG